MFTFAAGPSRLDIQRQRIERRKRRRRLKRQQRTNSIHTGQQQQGARCPTTPVELNGAVVPEGHSLSFRKSKHNKTSSAGSLFSDDNITLGGHSYEYNNSTRLTSQSSVGTGTSSRSLASSLAPTKTTVFTGLIITIGLLASTLFMGFGISGAVREQELQFQRAAEEMINAIQGSFHDFEIATKWIHNSCRSNEITREEFREVYEYLISDGLDVQSVQWAPNVTHDRREVLEFEASLYYAINYPDFEYQGITGFEEGEKVIQYRSEQPFYFPYHLLEPVEKNNYPAIDFDLFSSPEQRKSAELALSTWLPVTSHQTFLVEDDKEEIMVTIMHPGIPLSNAPELRPQDVAVLSVRIEAIVARASRKLSESLSLYIYDTTIPNIAEFLYAAEADVVEARTNTEANLTEIPMIELDELVESTVVFYFEDTLELASQTWTISVVALEDTFQPDLLLIIVAGKIVLIATLCLGLWIYTSMRRNAIVGALKRETENEKARIHVANAKQAVRTEQELNDYIAHEVRNPLAAALSACTFVKSEISEKEPMTTKASIQSVREDVHVIDTSLHFINDLLRNMLDMHRAASKKLNVELAPLDVLQDILDPVGALLYQRDLGFEVIIECPKNLFVMTDRLRLKQVMLNLGRNSAKFVERGFVKLGAEVIDDEVIIYVADSGPGIDKEKRRHLFSKFQESLDVLDQGTGIGLSLCKSMVSLLDGTISLDDNYTSGVEGCPGSKFIVNLKIPPLDTSAYEEKIDAATPEDALEQEEASPTTPETSDDSDHNSSTIEREEREPLLKVPSQELPEHLSVLFVDDDMILRKLFVRSVRRVAPGWKIQEAANGERALQMVEEGNDFDIIFLDQYMASHDKSLLGTETARALRARGVSSILCGLSANDVEQGFLSNGANAFMFKPFPCEKEALRAALLSLLYKPPEDEGSGNPAEEKMLVRFDDSQGVIGGLK